MHGSDKEDIPTAIASSDLEIAPGLKLRVHVLDNGQRVIDEADMLKFLNWLNGDPAEGRKKSQCI